MSTRLQEKVHHQRQQYQAEDDMARKRLSFCKCGAIKEGLTCSQCKPNEAPTYKTTTERGYGADWQKLSKNYRAHNPLCEDCQAKGYTTPSTQVHHSISIATAPTMRLKWANLVALCDYCHEARHLHKK